MPSFIGIKRFDVYLAHKKSAASDPVIIPYKVIKCIVIILFGINTGSLSTNYSCAKYNSSKAKSLNLYSNLPSLHV